jgi:hypothetical protein
VGAESEVNLLCEVVIVKNAANVRGKEARHEATNQRAVPGDQLRQDSV